MNKNQFRPQEQKLVLESFTLYDLDNDGRLTSKEVTALVKNMLSLTSDTPILKLLSQVDDKHRGYLNKPQFLTLMAKLMMTITSEKDMQQSFKIFQSPNQKGMTRDSLRTALINAKADLPEEDILQIISQLDEDKDGKVIYEDFKKIMNR